ncbi:hypothetical protein EGT07_01160 [Herbaspirillum sp. HC18]|nr:hypothetical protein EGT07_01160 [Herbaspirillum sp. HC18]
MLIRHIALLLMMAPLAACESVVIPESKPHELPRDVQGAVPARQPQASSAPARLAAPQPLERRAAPTMVMPVPPPVTAPQSPAPKVPVPVTSCDAGGCWAGGNRYNGTGGTYLDKGGRLCQGNGTWMQCF